jgi:hypothetical protein
MAERSDGDAASDRKNELAKLRDVLNGSNPTTWKAA